jgi:hypothetical protein
MLFDHGTNLLIQGVMRTQGSEPGGDVAARIRTIHGDRAHPYNNPRHVDHQRAVTEMNALYSRLQLPETGLRDELDVVV